VQFFTEMKKAKLQEEM